MHFASSQRYSISNLIYIFYISNICTKSLDVVCGFQIFCFPVQLVASLHQTCFRWQPSVFFDIFSFSLDFLLLHFLVFAIFIAGFLFGGRIFRINEDYEKSTRTTAQIQGIVMKILRNR